MSSSPSFLLWNARGLMSKLSEFKLFLSHASPSVVCLTETHLRPYFSPRFPGYTSYRLDRPDGFGGLLVLVHCSLQHRPVHLPPYPGGHLEALAVDVAISQTWSRVSLFYNPCQPISHAEFSHYLTLAGPHDLLCGDFNAHHPSWSVAGARANSSGNALFDVLCDSPLLLLNPPGLPTRVDPHTGSASSLDLFLGSGPFLPYSVRPCLDLGSDHTPLLLSCGSSTPRRVLFRDRWSLPSSTDTDRWSSWSASVARIPIPCGTSCQESSTLFTSALIQESKSHFTLRNSSRPHRRRAIWWSSVCARSVHARRLARQRFYRYPNPANRTSFNLLSRQSRETVLDAKKATWQLFLSRLDPRTPMAIVWRMFRAMTGYLPHFALPLTADGAPLAAPDAAEALASHFSASFSRALVLSEDHETTLSHALACAQEVSYNALFSDIELRRGLHRLSPRTSPGADLLHNAFLLHLPPVHHRPLLALLNQSFLSGELPAEWRSALVVPIPKPGKDPTLAASYRPISLLSCVGKLMERLVCDRLSWYLETRGAFLPQQFGFRRCLSTIDALTSLEHDIQLALRTRRVLVVLYLDLSAAFDRAAHAGVLYKLAAAGVRGRILRWIRAYLTDRSFRVSVAGVTSQVHLAPSGVPQGSILSPLLFNVLLSDLPARPDVVTTVYADDITVYSVGDSFGDASLRLQGAVDALAEWAAAWGLTLNPTKSAAQFFTRQRLVPPPALTIGGSPIPYVRQHRFLGLIFDSPTLTWRTHVEDLRMRCQKRLNIMRSLSGSSFGGSRQVLLRFYLAYIRGCTDYGLPLYSSAAPTLLSRLDVVHSTAARLIVGCWRSTPLPALFCELGLLPPDLHREFRLVAFHLQLLHRPREHPIHRFHLRDRFLYIAPFQGRLYKLPLLSRALEVLSRYGIALPPAAPSPTVAAVPPWHSWESIVYLDFGEASVRGFDGLPAFFADLLLTRHPGFVPLFTDGSLYPGPPRRVGASLVVPSLSYTAGWRLEPSHSILAAELSGLHQALLFLSERQTLPAVICTDSLSSLQLLRQPFPSGYRSLVSSIHRLLLQFPLGSVHFQWIPGHSGLHGNDAADTEARRAASSLDEPLLVPYDCTELRSLVRGVLWERWQSRWDAIRHRQALGAIKPSVRPWSYQASLSRRFETLLARLRLGLAPLNGALFKIRQAPSPDCAVCPVVESSHHYLLRCPAYAQQRSLLLASLRSLGVGDVSLQILLGGDTAEHHNWPGVCRAVERFVASTHRFD